MNDKWYWDREPYIYIRIDNFHKSAFMISCNRWKYSDLMHNIHILREWGLICSPGMQLIPDILMQLISSTIKLQIKYCYHTNSINIMMYYYVMLLRYPSNCLHSGIFILLFANDAKYQMHHTYMILYW